MRIITISRYPAETAEPLDYKGCIEGVSDTGQSWILFLDGNGLPSAYWAAWDDAGAVLGEATHLPDGQRPVQLVDVRTY